MAEQASRLDLLWGAKAIADEIGVDPRQAFHMLETRLIPAKKIGARWVAERGQLRAFFTGNQTQPEM